MSLPANPSIPSPHRSVSPKRRRTETTDDVRPTESVSQVGKETQLTLNERTTFSPPTSRFSSSPKRASSPTRETPIILRSACPPILVETSDGLKETPPEYAERLGNRLAEGIDFGFIPQGLQVCIHMNRLDVPKPDSYVPSMLSRMIPMWAIKPPSRPISIVVMRAPLRSCRLYGMKSSLSFLMRVIAMLAPEMRMRGAMMWYDLWFIWQ